MLTYSVKLTFQSQEEKSRMIKTLEGQRFAFNEASKIHYGSGEKRKNSIVELHSKFYKEFRAKNPDSLADITIQAEQECLSAYRSIKSNKHKIEGSIQKKRLSCRLNKNLYTFDLANKRIKLTCVGGKRIWAELETYDKFNELLSKYPICDPLIFERDGQIWLACSFNNPLTGLISPDKAIGIDLGIKRIAATSEGKIYKAKEYLAKKRKTRYLKRKLRVAAQMKKSKSAKRHLKKLRRKEANQTKNFIHHLTNDILKTDANVIVIEDLSQIKNPKNKTKKKYQNLNKISQIPFYMIRQMLEYKAQLKNKRVEVINPAFTSQIDFRTGVKDGIRKGCRYYGSDKVVLDAELNAANNIVLRSKLPVSCCVLSAALDGQATVTKLNAGNYVSSKPANLFVGR
jgi:IS605 OrfB family transposase